MSSMDRFEQSYSSGRTKDLPWYSPEPDEDLVRWFEALLPKASDVIDLGAGPTVHGMWLAKHEHRVTAVDGVSAARELALRLAKKRGVALEYHVANALEWKPAKGRTWDLVLDRGFLHGLDASERPVWLQRVRGLLRPGGYAVVKAFTDVKRGFGPAGLSAEQMLSAIDEGKKKGLGLVALERSSFNLSEERDDLGPHSAWTLIARKPR